MKKFQKNKFVLTLAILILYLMFVYFTSAKLTIVNALCYFIFLILIILIYRNELIRDWKEYKLDKKRIKTIIIYLLIIFGLSIVLKNLIIKGYSLLTGSNTIMDSSYNVISSLFNNVPLGTMFVFFLTVVFYPIVEELVFRKNIGDSIKYPILFIIVSSLLSWYFQVTLLNPSISEFVLTIGVLFNSIFASIVYTKKKNILYTIFPRMLYNLIICTLQLVYLFIK